MSAADPKHLDNLHRQILKQGSGLRSELEQDSTGGGVWLNISRVSGGSVLSVQVRPDRNKYPAYIDGHGNRIASADDAAIAFWEIRARI